MLKHFSLVLITIIFFSIFLSGCRLKGDSTITDSYSNVTLNYYKMYDDKDFIEPIIADYVASHNGLTINYKQFTDFDEYLNVILNEMAEGNGPDIFSMQNTWFASNYKKLAAMPAEYGTLEDFNTLFVDVASKNLIQVDTDGVEKIYGVPMTVDTLALYYNKSQFEDKIPNQGKPSTTWEGLKDDVALLNKTDNSFSRFEVSGLALGRADNVSKSVDVFYTLLLQSGIEFYDDVMSKTKFAVSQSQAKGNSASSLLEYVTSFADPNQKNYTWNEFVVDATSDKKELEAFAKGNVSMIFGYAYTYNEILDEIKSLQNDGVSTISKDDVKVVAIPQLEDPDVSKNKRVTLANYYAETVSRNSMHPDIAWDFLVFLTQKNNLQTYFEKSKNPTSRRDMIEEQKKIPIYGVFASQIGYAESFPIVNSSKYIEIFTNMIDSVSSGLDSSKSVKNAEAEVDKLLPSNGYINQKSDN